MDLTLILAFLAVVSILCQWISWWVKLPAILFLILAGLLVGPVLGYLDPDAIFGEFLFPFVSLSVAIILFEGSLTLVMSEIRGLGKVVQRLTSVGALATFFVVCIATRFFMDLPWEICLLFGALMVVTGPTVVMPMLRTIRPNSNISSVLRWEGIIIDTVGALLAVVVYEFIISSFKGDGWLNSLVVFGQMLLIGFTFGLLGGWILGVLIKKYWLPEYLHNLATLSMVTLVFAVSNALQHESGLLTVTVMGMLLANTKGVNIKEILNFKESLTLVFVSALFILLAARIDGSELLMLGWGGVCVFLVVQFVARPLGVYISTLGSQLKWQERFMIAWIGPRGIVAASVAALFAIRLTDQGFGYANYLVPLTFVVILGTVIFQSATAGIMARFLGVADPEPSGFLIIGANPVARAIGVALKQNGLKVVVADGSWDNISAARMEGLETYFGNVTSEHADQHLELIGVGYLMAISPQRDLNVVACMRYRNEFGSTNVFTMLTSQDKKLDKKHQASLEHRGNTLFGSDMTFGKMAGLLTKNYNVNTTLLTDAFTFENYLDNRPDATLLFALDPKNRVNIFYIGSNIKPGPGWKLIALNGPVVKANSVEETVSDPAGTSDSGFSSPGVNNNKVTENLTQEISANMSQDGQNGPKANSHANNSGVKNTPHTKTNQVVSVENPRGYTGDDDDNLIKELDV